MSGSLMNYDFGKKKNWRRMAWNACKERLLNVGSARLGQDGVCLYLGGPEDADYEIARSKGFRRENMIAVERERAACLRLRSRGANAINADIFDVLEAWSGVQVRVVYADLCCGLTPRLMELPGILAGSACYNCCVVVLNLMRGREKTEDPLHAELLRKYAFGKHRAQCYLQQHIWAIKGWAKRGLFAERSGEYLGRWMSESMHPKLSTYISESGQVFDSVIFFNPSLESLNYWETLNALRVGSITKASAQEMLDHSNMQVEWSNEFGRPEIRRKIAAAKALRTARMHPSVRQLEEDRRLTCKIRHRELMSEDKWSLREAEMQLECRLIALERKAAAQKLRALSI